MSRLEEVLRALAECPSGDYWSDLGWEEVAALLNTLVSTEWAQLQEMLPVLPDGQLQRLAYALSDVAATQAQEILVRLIAFGRDTLALGACDSLRAQLEEYPVWFPVSAQLFDYIAVLGKRCQEPWKTSCEQLLRYLRV